MRNEILVVDDEVGIRESLTGILEDEGYDVSAVGSGEEALRRVEETPPDVVLLDVWLPGIDGLEVLERMGETMDIPVIMISGHGSIEQAVKATQRGAEDFLEKPLSYDRVVLSVRRVLERERLRKENIALRSSFASEVELVGESPGIEMVRHQVASASASNSRVLVLGESGAGKELIARALHLGSPRSERAFVEVNCAAIPQELIESELMGHEKGAFTGATERKRGKFELADGGTLFLDEVADMSLPTQAKVLRVLETQEFQRVGGTKTLKVDVRVIAATNKNLAQEINEGNFREDLYYRLNVIPIEIPPLRERKEDIPVLAAYFLERAAAEYGRPAKRLSPAAIETLKAYSWPGNVRELRNVMERLEVMTREAVVEPSAIPPLRPLTQNSDQAFNFPGNLREARAAFEKEFITRRLREFSWNISRTADELGIERSNLHRKIKALNIKVP